MTEIIQSRRLFITGLGAIIAAPAIVKVSSLMPIKSIVYNPYYDGFDHLADALKYAVMQRYVKCYEYEDQIKIEAMKDYEYYKKA